VLLTPEYNHGPPAVLKNALDHVYEEWRRKPVGFVSWGGPGGGVRAVEQLRQIAVELQMAPMRQQVAIPNVYASLDDRGRPADPRHEVDAHSVLDELLWWSAALTAARHGAPVDAGR
jgi:NAD(P)H-dependent FMN reductase